MTNTMQQETSRGKRVTGYVLTWLSALFLLMDAGMKLATASVAVKATEELGYPMSVVLPLGVILLLCVVLYLIPRTSVLGAILLTGYLGGAVATHVRVGNPLFSHVLFPVYLGCLIWGGIYLRRANLRAVFPVEG